MPITQQDLPKLEKYDILEHTLEYLSIIYASYAYSLKWEVLFYISVLLINKNKLNSDSKKIPGKMTCVKQHLPFHDHW